MDHPFVFRPDGMDAEIFRNVVENNEYAMPERFGRGDVVVDIGVHVGSFCYAALLRGARQVDGFEADAGNYACASHNLRDYADRLRLSNRAICLSNRTIWRSDTRVSHLNFTANEGNSAAGHVILETGQRRVEALAFDDMIREVTQGGRRRVRLLKIDCKGSEFPILLTATTLHLVDEIVGEWHCYGFEGPHNIPDVAKVAGYDRYTLKELADRLEAAGLAIIKAVPHVLPEVPTGVFTARRPTRPNLLGQLKGRLGSLRRSLRKAG